MTIKRGIPSVQQMTEVEMLTNTNDLIAKSISLTVLYCDPVSLHRPYIPTAYHASNFEPDNKAHRFIFRGLKLNCLLIVLERHLLKLIQCIVYS